MIFPRTAIFFQQLHNQKAMRKQESGIDCVVGIDPGKNTGVAVWDMKSQCLTLVDSCAVHEAMDMVRGYKNRIMVVVEDARKSGGPSWKKLGAGSVRRDSVIWEDFLQDEGIPYVMVAPNRKSNGGKVNAKYFATITRWVGRTNQHGRDAAMLVWGVQPYNVAKLKELYEKNK